MTKGRKRLLVVEDGSEYEEFARTFLGEGHDVVATRSAVEAVGAFREAGADALFVDLRFDRAPVETLVGDLGGTATRLFGGDRTRALRYLQDQQGTLVLAALREAGCHAPAVFVHDFPQRRLENLRRLYGEVHAIASFDAAAIRTLLAGVR